MVVDAVKHLPTQGYQHIDDPVGTYVPAYTIIGMARLNTNNSQAWISRENLELAL